MSKLSVLVIAAIAQFIVDPSQAAPLDPQRFNEACKFVLSIDHTVHYRLVKEDVPRQASAGSIQAATASIHVLNERDVPLVLTCQFTLQSGDRLKLERLTEDPVNCPDDCPFRDWSTTERASLNRQLLRRTWH